MWGFTRKRKLTAVLLLFLFGAPVVYHQAWANEIAQKEEELRLIQQRMLEQENRAAQARSKVKSVSGELQQIQTQLSGAQADYESINNQLEEAEEHIRVNTELIAKAEKSLAARTKILNQRMRDIYKNGQVSYLDVLVGAADFTDFTTRFDLLKRVLNQDAVLIAKVKAERELVIQKKAELERDRAAILELKKEAAEKKGLIQSQRDAQQRVLNLAVSEKETAERAYQELLETSRQIERMIRNAGNKGGAANASGAMIWPTEATEITSPFGWRTHPVFGTQRLHTGIDIGADYGDAVGAADHGVVIYSDWMGGYGKAVIIDHGNGLSTLYAHNSQLLVVEGQTVRKGQTISRVGSTGYSTGPHLHFEVRKNGSPVNPLGYLP